MFSSLYITGGEVPFSQHANTLQKVINNYKSSSSKEPNSKVNYSPISQFHKTTLATIIFVKSQKPVWFLEKLIYLSSSCTPILPKGRKAQHKILERRLCLYVVACQIRTVPSSDPVIMMGNSGWKQTADTLWVWPSNVWTQLFVW